MKPDRKLELTVLSTALLDNVSRTIACSILQPDFFLADPRNSTTFTYIASGHTAGEPISVEWLRLKLSKNGESGIDDTYISELYSHATGADISPVCDTIVEIYGDIRIRNITEKYHQKMLGSRNAKEIFDQMAIEIDQVYRTIERKTNRTEAEIALELFETSKFHAKNKTILLGHDTGFVKQNRLLDGWQQKLYVILALASMGKTALLLHYKKVLNKLGVPSAFYSLETSDIGIVAREASVYIGAPISNVRKGILTEKQWARFEAFEQSRKSLKSIIDDNSMMTIENLTNRVRRLKVEMGLEVLFLDYVQILGADKSFSNKKDKVDYVVRGLKYIAEELGVAVIGLSQAKRDVEGRADKRPKMSDNADSSEIERAAWAIMGLFRPGRYGLSEEKIGGITKHHGVNDVELSVLKNKEGPTGVIDLEFIPNLISYKERGIEQPNGMPEIAGLTPIDEAISKDVQEVVPF